MYVCLCKGVTDTQIKECVNNGATSLKQVRKELGVATQCCKCLPEARTLVDEQLQLKSACDYNNLTNKGTLFFPATSNGA